MSASGAPASSSGAANRGPNPVSTAAAAATLSAPTSTSAPKQPNTTTSRPLDSTPAWMTSSSYSMDPSNNFTEYSPATAEILNRLRSKPGNTLGTPAFEAKRAEVLQNYVTSDKLPTPPPIANNARRGRGGASGTPSQLKTDIGASPASVATPTSARGSGRGRGRGRGGRGGRGGKRKRSESFDDSDNDSDISSSYTPLPTKTKSGRNVNKPVAFVPTLPEPTPAVKRRRSTKTILAAQCKICHRGTDPGNNRIVFCDACTTPYHQYCHNPPIDNEVVNVLEKEWLCGPCARSKQNVVEGTEGLVAGDTLSIDEKRAYLSTLPQHRLVSLLLHATVRHPELPIFPSNVETLLPDLSASSKATKKSTTASSKPTQQQQPQQKASQQQKQPSTTTSITSPQNGLPQPPSASNTPHSLPASSNPRSTSSEMDPAEAQLLGEISLSHHQHIPSSYAHTSPAVKPHPVPNTTTTTTLSATQKQHPQPPVSQNQNTSLPTTTTSFTNNNNNDIDVEMDVDVDVDITMDLIHTTPPPPPQSSSAVDVAAATTTIEEYDTDPPAHYPKAGNGLARTLRNESEELQWLVDDNFEVFSHAYRGDGEGDLNGL